MIATADIFDEHAASAAVCELLLQQFGGVPAFAGSISTVRCHEDNVLLKRCLSRPGDGGVLVVDGGGSMRFALLGDHIGTLAVENGWSGIVLNACVRDVDAIGRLPIGIKALGAIPRPSSKTGAGEIGVPVAFGGITFNPGAMLYSDDDGIVVLGQIA